MSTPVEGREQIAQVAALSAHEVEIGDLIAEVMEKVGKDGVKLYTKLARSSDQH